VRIRGSQFSKVFIWTKHVPKRFTLPTSIPDMKVLSVIRCWMNGAIISVDNHSNPKLYSPLNRKMSKEGAHPKI